MEPDSQIVIGPDGTVLAATGELSPGLDDATLRTCEDVPHEIRDAGQALLHRLRGSRDRVLSQSLTHGGQRTVQLIAIEAWAIGRTATDLRALLASKLAVLTSQAADAGVTLSVVADDDVPAVVHLDAEKVVWAVTTLVGNALRHMRSGARRMAGGTVTVRVTVDPTSADVTVEVQDDGPGIPADTVARLFKRDGLNVQGAGLAVLLIADMCGAHGGTVEVRSSIASVDHGTAVRLTFPTPA